jgi:hypothetical protein
MNQAALTGKASEADGTITETPWDEVDDQIKRLDAAIAAVAHAKVDFNAAEKSNLWPSFWQILFHVLMALPLAFEIYFLTHPLMFQK